MTFVTQDSRPIVGTPVSRANSSICRLEQERAVGRERKRGSTVTRGRRPSCPTPIVRSQAPYNAEPRRDRLRENFVTDSADFYVRSHGDVPEIDAAIHRLRVSGLVATPLDLGMDELRTRFAERTVEAVLQCAGNRRADLDAVSPVSGDPWEPGAIGNAVWTGVSLADVLRAAGADETAGRHVGFSSLDECDIDGKRFTFGASIPIEKAMAPEVLLAFAMNGEPLAPDHGFPLRVVVPGFAGVRSPKWLAAIEVRDRPLGQPDPGRGLQDAALRHPL